MALNRIRTWLAASLLVTLLSTPGFATDPVESDMQLFAPAETGGFGGGVRANEGFFALVDFIQWTISKPQTSEIGAPGLTRNAYLDTNNFYVESNSLNTNFIDAEATLGERFQIGTIDDGEGFMLSGFYLHPQTEKFTFTGAQVVFSAPPIPGETNNSPEGVPNLLQGYIDPALNIRDLPTVFDTLKVTNSASAYRIDLDYIHRMEPTDHCGTFEWYFGGSYLNFTDEFNCSSPDVAMHLVGPSTLEYTSQGGILNDSYWNTRAVNNIFGPELKLRWFRTYEHWTWDATAGFMAGFNRQDITQSGEFAEQANNPHSIYLHGMVNGPTAGGSLSSPLYLQPTSFQNSAYLNAFSGVADFNGNISYAITRAVSVRVGYTFMWVGNVARPVDMIDYQIGTAPGQKMGIVTANNKQDVFIQGINLGVELNR